MKHSLLLKIVCLAAIVVSLIAMYREIYIYDIRSIALLTVWAVLAIAGFAGNAVVCLVDYLKKK